MMFRRVLSQRVPAFGVALGLLIAPVAGLCADNGPAPLQFSAHAAAYAQQSGGSVVIDPHVFVSDPNAPDTTGPEGIHHIAGLRPARQADDPSMEIFNAAGDALDLSLGHWFATTGTAQVFSDPDGPRLRLRFSHAIPFGMYSVFLSKGDAGGYALSPLRSEDGDALFTASGDGTLRMTIPVEHPLGPSESILLVYHSDDLDHGDQPGDLGTDAHVQLVLFRQQAPHGDGDAPAADQENGPPMDGTAI